MSSVRHMPADEAAPGHPDVITDDDLLDAAQASILAVGWRRSTLTDVAKRAGVSRMTIYRRWPTMRSLLADLMVREWSGFSAAPVGQDSGQLDLAGIADLFVANVSGLRGNALFTKILRVDPDLLLPYLLQRRGRTQDALLGLVAEAVRQGQQRGVVRAGDPTLLARSVLLAAQGFAFSATTMTEEGGPALADLDGELRHMLQSYLAP